MLIASKKKTNKQCYFCTNNIKEIDYKNAEVLKSFQDSYGRIAGTRRTGVCSKHQRKLATAIKRARFLGLLPFLSR
jgi:small subunit ribosomal protein S18